MSDSDKDKLPSRLDSSPLPQTVEQAKEANERAADKLLSLFEATQAAGWAEFISTRDALIAACRAEATAEIAAAQESTRLAMLREANWNQMYHDQRDRAERAEATHRAQAHEENDD